jgi:hypothetical protein
MAMLRPMAVSFVWRWTSAYGRHVRAATAAGHLPGLRHKPSSQSRFRGRARAAGPATLQSPRDSRGAHPPSSRRNRVMKTDRPEANAELQQSFEPLRTGFAVFALLLGMIAALHM